MLDFTYVFNDGRWTYEIKSRIATAKAALNKKEGFILLAKWTQKCGRN
jgi:hypothetical protein